ncbi:hypothetical protein Tco_0858057 [Tanacetum coccineum]|uniref:Uncharacterized protein n=1 Tax=Tanacetum coccineum TaxID=301880 RepID=A0ABQ5B842_9ASTR
MASRNGRLMWICLNIERSRSSSSSFFCFFNLDGKGRLDGLEGRPTDHLGTGRILLFYSIPLLSSDMELKRKNGRANGKNEKELSVLETDPDAFDGLLSASSSKRFLPAIARDSFCYRWQAALLSLQNSLSSSLRGFVNLLTVLRVMVTDLQNR